MPTKWQFDTPDIDVSVNAPRLKGALARSGNAKGCSTFYLPAGGKWQALVPMAYTFGDRDKNVKLYLKGCIHIHMHA